MGAGIMAHGGPDEGDSRPCHADTRADHGGWVRGSWVNGVRFKGMRAPQRDEGRAHDAEAPADHGARGGPSKGNGRASTRCAPGSPLSAEGFVAKELVVKLDCVIMEEQIGLSSRFRGSQSPSQSEDV